MIWPSKYFIFIIFSLARNVNRSEIQENINTQVMEGFKKAGTPALLNLHLFYYLNFHLAPFWFPPTNPPSSPPFHDC